MWWIVGRYYCSNLSQCATGPSDSQPVTCSVYSLPPKISQVLPHHGIRLKIHYFVSTSSLGLDKALLICESPLQCKKNKLSSQHLPSKWPHSVIGKILRCLQDSLLLVHMPWIIFSPWVWMGSVNTMGFYA